MTLVDMMNNLGVDIYLAVSIEVSNDSLILGVGVETTDGHWNISPSCRSDGGGSYSLLDDVALAVGGEPGDVDSWSDGDEMLS